MKMQWIEPAVKERENGKPPPLWLSIAASIGLFILCFILTVLTWKHGKPMVSPEFFIRSLLVPALLAGAMNGTLYIRHEDGIAEVRLWNYLRRATYACWRLWAQHRTAIIGSVVLTPEKDLGVRMLGLEGSVANNAGKTLALATDKKDGGVSRTQQVLEQLVTPYAPHLTAAANHDTFSIMLQSEREEDVNDLRSLLRKLIPRDSGSIKITHCTEAIDMGLIEKWLGGNAMPSYCLVLAYKLHAPGAEPVCSEAAASVLFASRQVVENSNEKIKPDAWLFRPASAGMDRVFDTLTTMLAAQQTPNERIKHLWLTHIPGQGRHATLSAVKDAGLDIATHDVDAAIGLPGPVNTLLVHALAARMVQHGQGTQLVATPYKGGVMLDLIGTSIAHVEIIEEESSTVVNISRTCLVICQFALSELMLYAADVPAGYLVGVAIAFSILLTASAFTYISRDNRVAAAFVRALPWGPYREP